MPIFEKNELEEEFQFAQDVLPTNNHVMKFVLSRTAKLKHGERTVKIREMAKQVVEIWEKADCCPHSVLRVTQIFEQLQQQYTKYLKKSSASVNSKHRKRPSTSPPPQPTRKSSRQCSPLATQSPNLIQATTPPADSSMKQSTPSPVTPKSTRSKPDNHFTIRKQWDADFGSKLFDILYRDRIIDVVKRGGAFDNHFYDDQSTSRRLIMQRKVTSEFKESEVQRLQTEARRFAREMSAKGLDLSENIELENDSDENSNYENPTDSDFKTPLSSQNQSSIVETRNQQNQNQKKKLEYVTTCNKEVQVSDLSLKTTVRDTANTRIVQPKYVKALSLIMAEGLSAAEAVKCAFIWDTEVYDQKRLLPLALDKDYINMKAKLKKLSGESNVDVDEEPEVDAEVQIACETSEDMETVAQDSKLQLINFLKGEIMKKKNMYKENNLNIFPDLRTVRRNHHLMAVYVEKQIGEELVKHGGFIIPDGTSRNKVGEISAVVMKVDGKMRAFKSQRIGKGDRSTWAEVVVHMLQRLTVASNSDISIIWESIKTVLSDLCKVNKMLAAEISKLIGSSWVPGQLFCVLHYVLAIPESIKAIFASYQSQIGRDKLFPETTGFEMNINDKVVVVQILDVWLRLTSIRWHGRMWNR